MSNKDWGPDNPHPLSKIKTELIWDGKYDEYGRRREISLPKSNLPLQKIETVDAPMDNDKVLGGQLSMIFDEADYSEKHHSDSFRNKLIWGDNKLIIATLLEEYRGKIDLIYIDPPFDVGADFKMKINMGDKEEKLQKEQSIIEAVAYRDMWGMGTDSYLNMLYGRLTLMKDLLSEKGSIYLHCDTRLNAYLRIILDNIFGKKNFRNEIVWWYLWGGRGKKQWNNKHDTILFYSKTEDWIFNYKAVLDDHNLMTEGSKNRLNYNGAMVTTKSESSEISSDKVLPSDTWYVATINAMAKEKEDYPTQKPEALLERIILASSDTDSIVADFFCGSGTTLAVAEKLGRKWIGVDLGKYAIHTSRKRLLEVQRELKESGMSYRPFDIYNLGRYERQWWQKEKLKNADEEHRKTVLKFYKAIEINSSPSEKIHGKKAGKLVHVDNIDSIFSLEELEGVLKAAKAMGGKELHCLAWEFEMDMDRHKRALEAENGIKIKLIYIPREIMESNRNECQFFEAGYLEAEVVINEKSKTFDVELKDFIPSLVEAPEKEIKELQERVVNSPFDFIDFWSVDFDYDENGAFEHRWQDFRTRKNRKLKTRSEMGWKSYEKGKKYKICVKVIDVFGIDTSTVLEVEG